MATIPQLDGEPDTLDLSYGTSMTTNYRVRRVAFGDGYVQRARDGLNTRPQVWRLTWKAISDAQAEQLRTFFDGLAGVTLIQWTPYNQATQLQWTANDWTSTPSGYLIQDCSVTLTQEFDL